MSDWYVNIHRCFIMSMMYARNLVDLQLKYYTDWHEVDEDLTTILIQGGGWFDNIIGGITQRNMWWFSSQLADYVASSTVKILILYGCS